NRSSSISPARSRSRSAVSTWSCSNPAARRRVSSSRRLRHRTARRPSARSFAVPRGFFAAGPSKGRARWGPTDSFPLAGRRPGGLPGGLRGVIRELVGNGLGDLHRPLAVVVERGHPDRLADLPLDLGRDVRVLLEERACVLLALAELLALV